MRERERERATLPVIVSYIRDKALPCGTVAHCVSFSFDFPLDGVQISRQRPVQSGVLSNYKHFVLQNALLMSGKRVQRASLIRSNVSPLTFLHSRSLTHPVSHSCNQSLSHIIS